ncbi:dephospho-CoA kinase [Guyparkeria sp. 1SP6A2]|nr:dephospho-CoA kinase [Guyparkeria sp. 1SP6A2]
MAETPPDPASPRARILGLTGGIASGKSLVADLFAELGIPVIDTDRISRQLVEPGGECRPAIETRFGPEVFRPDGQLDRGVLRQRILAEPSERAALEAILHPAIRRHARQQAISRAHQAPYVIVVVPLLAEPRVWPAYREWLDGVITVVADRATRRERLLARPGLDAEQADGLLAAQTDDAVRLAISDYRLDNDGSPSAVKRQVIELDRQLRQASDPA